MAGRYMTEEYLAQFHTYTSGASDRSSFSSSGSIGSDSSVDSRRKTPRPPNAWILYRSDTIAELKRVRSPDLNRGQGELSKMIAQQWKNESDAVRKWYEQQAELKKLEHREQNPGYKYQPAPRGSKQKPKDPRLGNALFALEEEGSPEGFYEGMSFERRPSLADKITAEWASQGHSQFSSPPIPQYALDPSTFGMYGMADVDYHDSLNYDYYQTDQGYQQQSYHQQGYQQYPVPNQGQFANYRFPPEQ
ncbi:hypothetical protein BT69DRAFT_1281298 [Atractiella rhizophila]|nr:hypothetical protein BT69DRAFT_1281298 [Atractiella rhizophila]